MPNHATFRPNDSMLIGRRNWPDADESANSSQCGFEVPIARNEELLTRLWKSSNRKPPDKLPT
jgi:hypothetical protein